MKVLKFLLAFILTINCWVFLMICILDSETGYSEKYPLLMSIWGPVTVAGLFFLIGWAIYSTMNEDNKEHEEYSNLKKYYENIYKTK